MSKKLVFSSVVLGCLVFGVPMSGADWNPPSKVSREAIVEASNAVLARPDIKLKVKEDIFRIRALEMDWDIGAMVYEPEDPSKIPVGPDGRKIGVFLLHGGEGDHRSMDDRAHLLAGKFGFKVANMSYPGRLYLLDPSRDWPGDTMHPDGTVRTPIWKKDELITADQYEVIEDKEESRRKRWGTLILACAKEGTEFYHRMAAWPVAFEEAGKELMRRHLPEGQYSIYVHGHSTGGPFVFMLSQRVPNIVGVIGMENSPFGYIYGRMMGLTWDLPFNCLRIRSWRDTARYVGPEVLAREGPQALMRLPELMEEVLESWKRETKSPQFKAENTIHFNGRESLAEAARAAARRLNMTGEETEALVKKYIGYTQELAGKGVKPVPPVLFGIAKTSRDHSPEAYSKIYLPMFAAMNPAPKVRVVQFDAGTHGYSEPEPGLPMGVAPAAAKVWYDAIMGGYYQDYARRWSTGK